MNFRSHSKAQKKVSNTHIKLFEEYVDLSWESNDFQRLHRSHKFKVTHLKVIQLSFYGLKVRTHWTQGNQPIFLLLHPHKDFL